MDKKYCINCGKENETSSVYCISCGNSLETNDIEIVQKPKKKKGKGLLVTLIILLVIAGLIFGGVYLYKKINFFSDPFPDIDTLEGTPKKSLSGQLEDDLNSGKINVDAYIRELAKSVKEPVLINENYSNLDNDFNDMNYLFKIANENVDSLSPETVKYLYDLYTMNDVVWDVKEEVSYEDNDSIYDYDVQNVKKTNGASINKLDHVKLSRNGHFLVYYSTDGKNAISNSKAKKIANYLEDVVSYYKDEYGYDFKYEPITNQIIDTYDLFSKMSKPTVSLLLKNNDIDLKYMDTAMPIYIIDTDAESTNLLGWNCASMELSDQLLVKAVDMIKDDIKIDTARATYAFPYTVVSTSVFEDFNDAKIVLAHETFHHYQHYICGNNTYATCKSGLFTLETTADLSGLMASKVKKNTSTLNSHALWYIYKTETPIDKIYYQKHGLASLGYPAFIFAYNYANIVPNGKKIIDASSASENALSYLKNNSSNKYDDVLVTLAEKNLTHDYSIKSLIPYDEGKPVNPKNHLSLSMNIIRNESIEYSSMHYYYYDPWYVKNALDHTQIKFEGNSSELYILFFVKEKGEYKKVYSQKLDSKFIVDAKEFVNYEEIAFAVVNTSVNSSLNYTVNTGGKEDTTISLESLGLKAPKKNSGKHMLYTSSLMCYKVEDDDMYKTVTQVKVEFGNGDDINDMYARGTIQMKNYNPDDPSFKLAKNVVSGLIFLMKGKFKKEFGSISLKTKDLGDRYSITARVKKDYYKAIKSSFNTEATTREEIYDAIQKEGFICEFQ